MKKTACFTVVIVILPVFFVTTAFCGNAGKTEQDKYLENGRFKVGTPGCDKSDQNCTDTTAYNKLQKKLKLQRDSKAKPCPSCAPVKENVQK